MKSLSTHPLKPVMTKAERLLKILTLLKGRRQAITAAALAEQLQVSERTIYRDIEALSLSGAHIEGEAGVGYVLQKGSMLPPLTFSESELESLILGVRMVQSWGDPELGQEANSALAKIRAIVPDHLHYLKGITQETLLVPDYERSELSRFGQPLRQAIKRYQKIYIQYQKPSPGQHPADKATGERSERIVWPLGLVYWGKVWTLVSWCENRSAYRMFRLDRIHQLETLGAHFETSDNCCLQDYLENHTEG